MENNNKIVRQQQLIHLTLPLLSSMVLNPGYPSETPVALCRDSDSQTPPWAEWIKVLGSGALASMFSQSCTGDLTRQPGMAKARPPLAKAAKNHISPFESVIEMQYN